MYIPPEPVTSPRLFLKIPKKSSSNLPYNLQTSIFCSNGRSALYLALKMSELSMGDTVLLPSYLCHSVATVFRQFKLKTKFYRLLENLEIDFTDLKDMREEAKAMLIIHYFGFPQPIEKLVRFCQEKEILLIEDCAQALFGKFKEKYLGTFGDFGFFSLRKALPLLDGGMLLVSDRISRTNLSHFDSLSNNHGQIINIFPLLFRYLEVKLGVTPRTVLRRSLDIRKRFIEQDSRRRINFRKGISSLSSKLLEKIEESEVVERRRRNYLYLFRHSQGINNIEILHPSLPDGCCPLSFPILTSNRDNIKNALLRRGINLRTFWDILPEEISPLNYPVSHQVAGRILLLPVHQDLQKKNLDYILLSLKEVVC